MTHPFLVSLARSFPVSSRLMGRIDSLWKEREALQAENAALRAKLADAMAWLDITSKWQDPVKASFAADGMMVTHRPVAFLADQKFKDAYRFGVEAGHYFTDDPAALHIEWRAAICCWAAWHASKLTGDFVECGVNTGIFSRALCRYIDFNSTGKNIYLFDTYEGVPIDQAPDEMKEELSTFNKSHYPDVWQQAQTNFAEFPTAKLIRGRIPETLNDVEIGPVAYLSIDMNIPLPEVAALEFFWPKLVSGGVVVFDDYGFSPPQRTDLDAAAARWGVKIWELPTGQGLLLKP